MADERMIKILLSMGVDETGARRVLEQFQKFQKSLADLEKEAQMVKKAIGVALSAGEDTKELEQELERIEAVMREVRKQGAGEFGRAFGEQAQAAQKMREELEKASAVQAQMARDARDNAYHLRDIGQKLSQVGQYVGGVGSAILSPLTQASQLFLSTAAQSDPLVMRWKSEMSEIQDAWLRIGRVATEELLPLLHTAAKFADKLADFVEANPDLIKIALGAGAGLKVAGDALQTAGSVAMILGSLKQLGWLGAKGGAGSWLAGAGKAVTGFITGTGGAMIGGIGLGLAGYEAIAQSEWGKRQGFANLGQYASVGAYGLGKLFGGEEMGREWFRWMGELTGVIEKQAKAAKTVTQAQLDAFSAFEDAQNKRKQYEQQSEEARNAIAEFGAHMDGRFCARR